MKASGAMEKIGLIFRATPHQGERWCLVGGRLWRNETMAEAIARQLRETLGPGIAFSLDSDPQPQYVAQYFPAVRSVGTLDPRQHALTPTFVIPVTGDPVATGEAIDFRWFDPARLPDPHEFGFGQDLVVAGCLRGTKIG
jgi:ADP-ribose pyrophosphatase YjhB (NUDIX family)